MFKKINIISLIFIIFFISIFVESIQPAFARHRHAYKCRYANCYHQYGKHYSVLKNSKNYQAKGVASWYGRRFNKKRTSSGERYNMYHMTAAHKTLPLSTYVQVTNLRNGRTVVVRVNDRGPFVSNRLIDLSYAAAKKLGMVGQGIAPVTVKAI